jgi:hypothetical protein
MKWSKEDAIGMNSREIRETDSHGISQRSTNET